MFGCLADVEVQQEAAQALQAELCRPIVVAHPLKGAPKHVYVKMAKMLPVLLGACIPLVCTASAGPLRSADVEATQALLTAEYVYWEALVANVQQTRNAVERLASGIGSACPGVLAVDRRHSRPTRRLHVAWGRPCMRMTSCTSWKARWLKH
jgi:hypothetical protein